jgi:hypothetical protein
VSALSSLRPRRQTVGKIPNYFTRRRVSAEGQAGTWATGKTDSLAGHPLRRTPLSSPDPSLFTASLPRGAAPPSRFVVIQEDTRPAGAGPSCVRATRADGACLCRPPAAAAEPVAPPGQPSSGRVGSQGDAPVRLTKGGRDGAELVARRAPRRLPLRTRRQWAGLAGSRDGRRRGARDAWTDSLLQALGR